MKDYWGSYECNACFSEVGSSVVFDVRVPGDAVRSARCPICGKVCELLDGWPADANGYGSRSEKDGIIDRLQGQVDGLTEALSNMRKDES